MEGREGREGKEREGISPSQEINKMKSYKTKSQKIATALMISIPCTQSGAL